MDPDQALEDILSKLAEVDELDTDDPDDVLLALDLLTEIGWSFDGLNEWLSRGGVLPKAWNRGRR